MLRFLRERTGKWGLYIVFLPIILVFVAWGVERFEKPMGSAAAVVNGETITITEYRNALQRMVEFYQQMMQGNFDEKAQKQFRVKEMALQQLIQSQLISEQAAKMGITVSDEGVRKLLMDITFLQKDGKFSKDNYNLLLNYYRMSAGQFEANLRKDAVIDKTRQLFEDGMMKSRTEEQKDKLLGDTKLNVEYLKVNKDKAASTLVVTDAQVTEFLAQDANQKKVKEYFDLHKNEFNKPERVRASHILIKAKKGIPAEEKAAKDKIAKIQAELKTAKFDVLARKYSDDPGSKAKGGDLDYFDKGRMVPEFEAVAFTQPIGKVSEPVQSDFGFHLILVTDKKPAENTPFEKASASIAKSMLAADLVDKKVNELDKLLASDLKAAISGLQGLQKDAKWEETGVFSVSDERIPKLAESEDLLTSALMLTKEKPISLKVIQVGKDIYVLRYKEVGKVVDTTPKLDPLAGQASGRGLFSSWSSQLMQDAKIQTNPMIMAEDAGQ